MSTSWARDKPGWWAWPSCNRFSDWVWIRTRTVQLVSSPDPMWRGKRFGYETAGKGRCQRLSLRNQQATGGTRHPDCCNARTRFTAGFWVEGQGLTCEQVNLWMFFAAGSINGSAYIVNLVSQATFFAQRVWLAILYARIHSALGLFCVCVLSFWMFS